jgi:hypothetical protein
MSNIFNSMTKYFGSKDHSRNWEVYQPRQQESNSGMIILGFSPVYLDLKPRTRVNNFDNL